jgi:hypothetical protein
VPIAFRSVPGGSGLLRRGFRGHLSPFQRELI